MTRTTGPPLPAQRQLPHVGKPTDDKQRIAARKQIRKSLAENTIHEVRVQELNASITELEQQLDDMAADHEAECKPLQAELKALENRIVDRVTNREASDPLDDVRHRELLSELDDKNVMLAEHSRMMRDRVKVFKREREIARRNIVSPEIAGNQLCLLATREAIDLHEGLKQVVAALSNVAKFLDGKLADAEYMAKSSERRGDTDGQKVYESRVQKWKVASQIAGELLADIQGRCDSARLALIDE